MAYGWMRFAIALLVFPLTISPYLFIRLIKKESVNGFREHVVLAAFREQLGANEKIIATSQNGSYSNMVIYICSIPLSLFVSIIDLYPMLSIVLAVMFCFWSLNASQMVDNYYLMVIVTTKSLYVYDHRRKKTESFPFDSLLSIESMRIMRWTGLKVNGSGIQPSPEIGNSGELVATVNRFIHNARDAQPGTPQ